MDGKIVLFERIRKTQEIISHNANHQNVADEKTSQLKNLVKIELLISKMIYVMVTLI